MSDVTAPDSAWTYTAGVKSSVPALSRRHFLRGGLALAGLGLVSGCGAVPGQPQPPRRAQRIGHVWAGTPTPDFWAAFHDQLRELGYVDGQSITIEDRTAGGDPSPCPTSWPS